MNSKSKKLLNATKYTASAVLFSIALSSCTLLPAKTPVVTDPNATKLIVWGFDDEDVWKPIAKDFASTNKGYTLVYEKQILDTNYENRALNSITSGQGPDVWAMPNDWVGRHKEKLYPMPDAMAKTFKMDDKFVKSVSQSVVFDNKIYALTPYSEPLMIYYNPKLFQKTLNDYQIQHNSKEEESNRQKAIQLLGDVPPKLWTDFVEATKLLTIKNGNTIQQSGTAIGTDRVANSQDILYLLMMQNETKILSDDKKLATFNLPQDTATGTQDYPGKRALEFYTSFANPNSQNYTWNDDLGSSVEAFANGKVAMIFGYSSLQNYLMQKYPNFTDYKKAFVPQNTQDATKFVDYARFNAFGVNNLSKKISLSWNLVLSLSTTMSETLNSANRSYTSQKASSYDISLNNRNSSQPERLALATANSLYKGRYPTDFDANMRNAIASVNRGNQDAKSALDLAANNISVLLRKEKW